MLDIYIHGEWNARRSQKTLFCSKKRKKNDGMKPIDT